MSDESRSVFFELERSSQYAAMVLKMSYYGGKEVLKLIQFMMRLHQEGILSQADFEDFSTFTKISKGNFQIIRMPVDMRGITEFEKESLFNSLAALGKTEEQSAFLDAVDKLKSDFHDFRDNLSGENIDEIDTLIDSLKGELTELDKKDIISKINQSFTDLPVVNTKEKIQEIKKCLSDLGINFCVIPNSGSSEQPIAQVAVDKKDIEKFMPFFNGYICRQMTGGVHRMDALELLSNNNISFVPIHQDILSKYEEILKRQGIDYAIAPDNNLSDGIRHIAFPSNQLSKAASQYDQLRQALMEKTGVDYGNFNAQTVKQFDDSASCSVDESIAGMREANKDIDECMSKFEGESINSPFADALSGAGIDPRNSESFECGEFFENENYVPLSVYDSLVNNDEDTILKNVQSESPDRFSFRIPGTWGENEQILSVDKSQVFKDTARNRFIVFVNKNESPAVLTKNGISRDSFKNGMDLYQKFNKEHQDSFVTIKPSELKSIANDLPKIPIK